MATVEVLPRAKWDELSRIADGFIPPRDSGLAIVARDNSGKICGRVFLVCVWHAEGIWVTPEARANGIGHALIAALEKAASRLNIRKVFAYSVSQKISRHLAKLGYKSLPLEVFTKEVR